MKVEFEEGKGWFDINLIPDNLEEAAQLLRFARQSKKTPDQVRTHFNSSIKTNLFFKTRQDYNAPNNEI